MPADVIPEPTRRSSTSWPGLEMVQSFGPGLLAAAHAPNESISVPSIHDAARIYALTALRDLNG